MFFTNLPTEQIKNPQIPANIYMIIPITIAFSKLIFSVGNSSYTKLPTNRNLM